jgi:hypothetical protein
MRLGPARRYDADILAPHGVSNEQQAVLHHANNRKMHLAVVFTIIHLLKGEWILEDIPCIFKTDAVRGVIRRRLDVSFKAIFLHDIRVTRKNQDYRWFL